MTSYHQSVHRAAIAAALIVAAFMAAPPARGEAQGGKNGVLYLVVLQPNRTGGQEFDVRKHGGTLRYRQGGRLAVMLPEQAIEGIRHDPNVRYIQRVVVGAPVRTAGESPLGSAAMPARIAAEGAATLTPATDGSASWTSGTYEYDPSGNITGIGSDTYRYDHLGRVATASVFDMTTTSRTVAYGYDAAGNLTGVTTDGVAVALPVDAATNRLSSGLGVQYDQVGNLSQVVTSLTLTEYRYDPLGMLSQGDGFYLYTADDERIATSRGLDLTSWNWTIRDLAGRPVRDFESFGVNPGMDNFLWTGDYYYAGPTLLASDREAAEGGRRHFHVDHLGTPRLVTNGSGQSISSHAYLPFGIEASSIRQDRVRGFEHEETHRFTGHERDGLESSNEEHTVYLDYMHARFYNPNWGRFLSVDPIVDVKKAAREPQMWNRYSYVTNNPLRYTDPDGRYRDGYYEKPMTAENLAMDEDTPAVVKGAFYVQGALLAAGAASEAGLFTLARTGLAAAGDAAMWFGGRVAALRTSAAAAEITRRIVGDSNRMNHIFGNPGHKLDGLVRSLGSADKVVSAVSRAVLSAGKLQANANGVFSVVVKVNGQNVEVRGRLMQDVVRIADFWVK